MIVKRVIVVIFAIVLVNALVLKPHLELTGAALKLTIQGLRDTKHRLETELQLLMAPLRVKEGKKPLLEETDIPLPVEAPAPTGNDLQSQDDEYLNQQDRNGQEQNDEEIQEGETRQFEVKQVEDEEEVEVPSPIQPSDELLILTKDLLNSKIFQKMGLQKLVDDGYFYNFTIGKDLIHNNLLVPKDSKNLFLFNTSDPLNIPKKLKNNFANFIDKSPPFTLPTFLSLIDYYLVIPKNYLVQHLDNYNQIDFNSIYSKTILKFETEKLPLFRKCINEGKPLLVFMFNGAATNEGLNTIMNIKNYLPTNGQLTSFSTFFDTFAKDWISNVNYESLIKSIFCTTNVDSLDESYCLRIKDNKSLHIFPAFYDISKFITDKATKHLQKLKSATIAAAKNDNTTTTEMVAKRENNDDDEPEIESQAFRQIHHRLSHAANHVSDVSQELSTDPKPVFERLDERLDQKIDSAIERINAYPNRLSAKKDSLQERLDTRKDNLKQELDLSKMVLDEKKTNYENKLKQAITSRLKKYKFKPHIFEKVQQLGSDEAAQEYFYQQIQQELQLQDQQEQIPHEVEEENSDDHEEFHRYANDPDNDYISKRSTFFQIEQDNLKHKHVDGGFVLPLSLIRLQEKVIGSPRHKRFSQVIFDIKHDPSDDEEEEQNHSNNSQGSSLKRVHSKRDSIYSDDEDCQKITWYNIFHYSIFGKPKFCHTQ